MAVTQANGSSSDYWNTKPDDELLELRHMASSPFSSASAKSWAMAQLAVRSKTPTTASSPPPQS